MCLKPGNRLRRFEAVWRHFRASPEVHALIEDGHEIVFENKAPPLTGPQWNKATKLPPAQMKVIRQEVKDLVSKGAMRKISKEEAQQNPGFYSKMFCVPKPNKKWRPIINLKPFNKYVLKKNFKMETVRDVRNLLQPGMWAATVDLQDAYYHIGLL